MAPSVGKRRRILLRGSIEGEDKVIGYTELHDSGHVTSKGIESPEAVEPVPLPTAEQYVQPISPIAACVPPISMLIEKTTTTHRIGRTYSPTPLKNLESRFPIFFPE